MLLVGSLVHPSAAQDAPTAFAEWAGKEAPQGLPLVEPALASGRAIVLHFTGDAGPDNIAQTITLNQLRGRYGNDVVFVRAENETTAGDRIFDAFGATRIPSTAVLDSSGRVVAVYEGAAEAPELGEAIDEARAASSPARSPGVSAFDLSDPLPSPADVVGHRAYGSTPPIRAALARNETVVLAFLGAFSRFHAQQEEALLALRDVVEGELAVLPISAEDPLNEPAFSDYAVTGVPTLFVVSGDGVVRAHFDGLTGLAELAAAADLAAPYAEGPGAIETETPLDTTPADPPDNALEPRVPVDPGPEVEVGEPPDPESVDPPLPQGPAPEPTPPGERTPIAAEGGDPANPLSPAAGSTVTVDSAVNDEYGPSRLVDGLLPGDEGFRPWVSASGHGAPFEIRIEPATPELRALILRAATGDPVLFGARWPSEMTVRVAVAEGEADRDLGTFALPADGSAYRIELPEEPLEAIILGITATHGDVPTCEIAEISAE